jgi:hypothetical protein
MPSAVLDHLVVTAPTLAAGAEFIRRVLGVEMSPGGTHPRVGTHNLLLRLGDTAYLEVIAADPAAPSPGRPRWFALDELPAAAPPRLAAWVARTDDIRAVAAASPVPLGDIEPMSRGNLHWVITVPPDGRPPLGGAAPHLIQWQADSHPATRLPDSGCSFVRLDLFHPDPARVFAVLAAVGLDGPAAVHLLPPGEPPRLVAHVDTPDGPRAIG